MSRDLSAEACRFLADKDNDPGVLQASLGLGDRAFAKVLVGLLDAGDKRAKNRAAKRVALLSETNPGAVHPHRERLAECLSSSETILLWNALMALGSLAAVDQDGWSEARVPQIFKLLCSESMITAGHAVTCLGRVAEAKPDCRRKIVKRLLDIGSVPRDAACAEILAGKVLGALEKFIAELGKFDAAAVRSFARTHSEASRGTTRRQAERVLRGLDRG